MAREGEAELTAGLRGEGASVEEKSAREEAFALRQSSDAGELSSDGRSMRARGDGSSEASSGEEMQD
jgi:hypothetical protein